MPRAPPLLRSVPVGPSAAAAAAAASSGAGVLGGARFDPAAAWPLRERAALPLPPLAPGRRFADAYQVVLLVDSCERQRAHRGVDRLVSALRARGLAVELRGLPVGDALWVARAR